MKTQSKIFAALALLSCVSFGFSDTFKNKESGEVFVGFTTQKVASGKTLVYNSDESKMMPIVLDNYEIINDSKGRRDVVSLLLLNQPQILLSPTISNAAAEAIINASNKGPQAIILQIDGPGGRGTAMEIIAKAISQTNNCPVIAYISEGAYSAAAVVAVACDKIYIKSTAGIGAVGSANKGAEDYQDYAEFLSIFNLDFQLNDFLYSSSLAKNNGRPELLVRAMIDMTASIIEVANLDGSKDIVEEKNRQQTQTLVRKLCEGISSRDLSNISKASIQDSRGSSVNISPADLIGKVLNLTPNEAIEFGLVDNTAESIGEILSKEQLSAKITPVPTVEKMLKKFEAAQRNINQGLYRIDQYERDIELLSNQFTTIDNQLRTGTQTREISQGDLGYRSSRRRETYSSYYDQDIVRSGRSRDSRNNNPRSQTVITQEPQVNIQTVYTQLTTMLQNAVGEYRRVLNIVDRWPGALPAKVSRQMLQNDMDSALSELDRLYRYQPTYQNQQQVQPQRTPVRRR